MSTTEKQKTEIQVLSPQMPKTLADEVLNKLAVFRERREINLPADYSPENALKSAWLTILETKDKNGKLANEVCSKESVANALLKMCIQGLSPSKAQCYFVIHGNLLTMMRSYQGTKAVAKRVAGIKDVLCGIIYENDIFEYEYDISTGRQKITKHVQKLENIDIKKIKGCYAVVIEKDNSFKVEIMTIAQVNEAWKMGFDSKAKTNFPDQMAKKTVTYRACKDYINSSNDADLYTDGDNDEDTIVTIVSEEIKENGNKENLSIAENSPVEQPKKIEKKEEKPKPEPGEEETLNFD